MTTYILEEVKNVFLLLFNILPRCLKKQGLSLIDWLIDVTLEFFLVGNPPPQSASGLAPDQANPLNFLGLKDLACKAD